MAEEAQGPAGPGGEDEAVAELAAPPAGGSGATPATSTPRRRLSDLRVIDLRAELKRRNLDTGGNKSVLLERLQSAIEEEGGNPDEVPMASENTSKKTPKRSLKGRKSEEEGGEDNGLEENSRDEQKDVEASSDNLQDIDMMDISVLDEAEIDNSSAVDCGDDYRSESLLDPDKDNIDMEMKELPEQLMESEENGDELDDQLEAASPDLAEVKDLEEHHSEPEDASESEQAQEANEPILDKKEEEEEDALAASTQSDEDLVDTDSQSGPAEAKNEEDDAKLLVVAEGEPSEQTVEEAKPDSDTLAVESRSGGEGGGGGDDDDESSKEAQTLEACSEETAESDTGPPQVVSPEAEKMEVKANVEEEPSATRESSAQEGGDQNTSSEESKEPKQSSKEEKGQSNANTGRNFWVSGLASSTRATDLKNLFSKYGKVVGAKVVTNARSPGARCYGFVTMSTAEETTKCIAHCHKTELHGKVISVERAKNEPATRKLLDKKDTEGKTETSSGDKPASVKKNEKADSKEDSNKADEKDEKGKEEQKSSPADKSKTPKSGSKGIERTVIMDKSKGEPVIRVKTTSRSKERSEKSQDRKSESREKSRERQDGSVPSNKTRDKRPNEEQHRSSDRRERQRIRLQAVWEQEERKKLEITREKLEIERARLEREQMERERLERERMYIENERRREQERIQREREELRRQHVQLRYDKERRVALRRPYDMDGRRDDSYWPEAKRMAMDDRHRSDFSRQDRFHDFDQRERGRYHGHPLDRREGPRGMMGDRERPHYSEERHRDPDRHSRDGWGYGSDRRMNEGRRIPPPSREGRDWGDHPDRSWAGNNGGGPPGREYERWRGRGRERRGHIIRGGMSGQREFFPGGPQEQTAQEEDFPEQERANRPSDTRFSCHY
ncbi:scaffold attachment factor B1-like isoform X3 [Erythrolamprus reginae]|uniref:scaffold attachment factor B1-like isoform X3 n=2 Tax=Erythrolamprus reginae TaxID=121349 RepID=UPI00396C77D9